MSFSLRVSGHMTPEQRPLLTFTPKITHCPASSFSLFPTILPLAPNHSTLLFFHLWLSLGGVVSRSPLQPGLSAWEGMENWRAGEGPRL